MPYWEELYEKVASRVNEIAGGKRIRLLDLGCGSCRLRQYLRNVEYVGVDRDESIPPAPHLVRADFLKDEIEGTYDVITALNVLEVLSRSEIQLLFRRVGSWLCRYGWFIVSLTNEANPVVSALRALGIKRWPPLSLEDVKKWLLDGGFVIVHIEPAGAVFLPFWVCDPHGREATVIDEATADWLNLLVKDESYAYFKIVYSVKVRE
jgi:predicted TPR repeat methyltransferase